MKEYRIQPVQALVHGLHQPDASSVLSEPEGYELFRRDGIRLISMGIYASEDEAMRIAEKHAGEDSVKLV